MDAIRDFDSVWKRFMVMCRAKLMEKSKQCALSVSAADISVQDAASMWFDPYDACGQWLKHLEKEIPQAGEKVKKILQQIELEEIPPQKIFPELGILGITAGGAAAGAGVGAWILHLGTVGTLLSAAIPAIALYPAMKGYQKNEKEKAEKDEIAKYLEQLSLVREEIEGILNYTC